MAKKCPKCNADNPKTATFCADCGTQLPSLEDIEVTETIETEEKNYDQAIDLFEQAYSMLPAQSDFDDLHAFFIFPLGSAYYRSGNLDKAKEEFERITEMTTGRMRDGDLYAKSFYMLGKIHEQQGNTAQAIEHYEKFLTLWKNADPGISEVEDAKKRVTGLKGE